MRLPRPLSMEARRADRRALAPYLGEPTMGPINLAFSSSCSLWCFAHHIIFAHAADPSDGWPSSVERLDRVASPCPSARLLAVAIQKLGLITCGVSWSSWVHTERCWRCR